MIKRNEDRIEAVNSILEEIQKNGKINNTYAFVSYSDEDKGRAYEVIEILLRNGVNLTTCETASREEVHNKVKVAECKCMIILISRNYIYDIDKLMDQYTRFMDDVRNNSDSKQQLPCLIIDIDNNRCKYKDDINPAIIENKSHPMDMDKYKETLKKGIKGLYQLEGGNFDKLIERQIETVEEGDIDEIRRQMSFILDYDGHLDNVTNLKDIKNYAGNTVKKLSNQGVDVIEELKKICIDHFDEWGKNIYEYTNEEGVCATIVCSEEELYLKRGSLVKENPTNERSENEKLNNMYKKYIMNGILKPASDIGLLRCEENIRDKMSLSEVTTFVNGESIDNCSEKWKNVKTNRTYREDNTERG